MTNSGNPKALRKGTDQKKIASRNALIEALQRLKKNAPTSVKKGTPISPASVSKEAGVDRGTLYNHRDILQMVKAEKYETKIPMMRRKPLLIDAENKVAELREVIKELQDDKAKLATSVASLDSKLRYLQKDLETVKYEREELKGQLAKVRPLKAVAADDSH